MRGAVSEKVSLICTDAWRGYGPLGKPSLYRPADDPSELRDLSEQQPAIVKQLMDRLSDWREVHDAPDLPPSSNLDRSSIENLRKAGYW